ncbi:autotransporter outer membrane beta-barrel domain-containing protein [Ruegeria halocynthiae]|uniref:autotransporter outer membrane beta-barrel domain-containing protein n=1 Tax=Ruegeria halocynthiae TaxID=985054 RepID=UPI00069207DA|nr:autotransporter outer membrane beta-barrel domain-containing protein [Ruegeria halocynthiae]
MKMINSGPIRPHYETALLRGGRMTKHKGQAASFAPALGRVLSGVSAAAIGAALTFGGGTAQAGSCTTSDGTNFVCSGAAAPGMDTTVGGTVPPGGGSINATTTSEFGLDVSSGNAVEVTADSITITDTNNSTIRSVTGNGVLTVSTAGTTITTNGAVIGRDGVWARNNGAGALAINVNNVTGTSNYGIYADGNGNTTSVSITASGTVTGQGDGIDAHQGGPGSMTIMVNDVVGYGSVGIDADSYNSNSTTMSITTSGTVAGSSRGIDARHLGRGALTITANNVQGTSSSSTGILARTVGGADIAVTTTGTIAGGRTGIETSKFAGAGPATITVSGTVQGGSGYGIYTQSQTGGMTEIKLQDGASVSATSGEAISNNAGDSRVTLMTGSSVAGAVRLNDGKDALTVEGGADISAATLFDGGTGTEDALTFSGFTGTFNNSLFTNFETLTASDGGNLTLNSAAATGFNSVLIDSGAAITAQNADFTFDGDLQVNATGQFLAGAAGLGNVTLSQSVLNNGLISTADGATGDRLTFGADLSGSGTIGLDVNLTDGTNDQVFVTGDSAGASQGLQVTKAGSTVDTAQTFTLVTVSGSSTASDFQLVNADFVTNDGAQAISDGDIAYLLEYDADEGEFFLSPFDNPKPDVGGTGGTVNRNPGGAFLAAGVQQFSDQLTFGSALGRIMGATQRGSSEANTVSRALNELTSTTRPIVWVQAEGQRDSYTVDDRDVETNSGGLRFGAGLPLAEIAGGKLIGGLEFGISSLSTDVKTSLTSADISTDAYDATLSALWIANSQLYVDGQLRYAYFDSTTRPNGGNAVDTNSDGYGLSVEVGKPFILQNGLTLVPHAQLMYSDINTDDVTDLAGGGQTGSLVDGNTLTARLGLRAEHEFTGNSVLFGQVDYYHAFDNNTAVAFGQSTVLTERGRNTAGLTLGGHVALSGRTTLYGEVSGETGLGSGSGDYTFGGNIGLEFRF